jgi:transposase
MGYGTRMRLQGERKGAAMRRRLEKEVERLRRENQEVERLRQEIEELKQRQQTA